MICIWVGTNFLLIEMIFNEAVLEAEFVILNSPKFHHPQHDNIFTCRDRYTDLK